MGVNSFRLGFILAFLFTFFTAHAGEENLGFSRVDSKETPAAIAKAAKSVFRIKVVSFQKGDEWDLTNPTELANLQKQIETLDKIDRQIAARQMAVCKADNEEKACLVTLEGQRGTAFLIEPKDGLRALMTAAHVAEKAFSDFEVMKEYANKDPKNKEFFQKLVASRIVLSRLIYIFDQKGNLLLDDGLDDQFYINLAKPPTVQMKGEQKLYNDSSDVVFITTNKEFSRPGLKIAAELPAIGSPLTSIGYPACTGCPKKSNHVDSAYHFRARQDGRNSNGRDMYYVNGPMIERKLGLEVMELTLLKLFGGSENLVFRTGENHAGMSGGPTLNEKGEVVGINTQTRQVANPQVNMNANVILTREKLKSLFEE